jgi:hypothetical protein
MEGMIRPEALVFDDTGFLKDGTASASASRQCTGTAGKVTNCQVGVSLHLASDHASSAVNWRLFLPQTWDPASAKADAGKSARRCPCRIPHPCRWEELSRLSERRGAVDVCMRPREHDPRDMMGGCGAATGIPGHDERVRVAATATDE